MDSDSRFLDSRLMDSDSSSPDSDSSCRTRLGLGLEGIGLESSQRWPTSWCNQTKMADFVKQDGKHEVQKCVFTNCSDMVSPSKQYVDMKIVENFVSFQ